MISMNGMRLSRREARSDERGMVSIMVVLVFMIVISLIVLGFAQISRRNQRVTLDQQLSTQAFYAAESGVNDAATLINNTLATGGTVYTKTSCAAPATPAAAAFYAQLPSSTIDAAHSVSYSCLMVNPNPTSLTFSSVGTTSTVFPLSTPSGAAFQTVTFTWQTKTGSATPMAGCPAGAASLPPTTAWPATCGYGVFRFDLVPTTGGSLTSSSLAAATMTTFVVPVQSGGTGSIPFAAAGANGNEIIGGNCDNTSCSLTITGLSANQYYARVQSMYEDVSLVVTGTDTSSATSSFAGAQTLIDATGKAQDVLRRIQVRISDSSSSGSSGSSSLGTGSTTQVPDYPLESTTSVCKRFSVMSTYFQNNAAPADGAGNQLCT